MKILTLILSLYCTVSGQLVINHNNTRLPTNTLEIKNMFKIHYAHTSHGYQIVRGLFELEKSPTYNVNITAGALSFEENALCILDGQSNGETYILPEKYWSGEAGLNLTRNTLNTYRAINISEWAWCVQLDTWGASYITVYLNNMSALEDEFPNVTFIYMTGNAQATGSEGFNRYLRNQQIRNYCIAHKKILFDFEDLDSWWFNPSTNLWEQATTSYNGVTFPVEHPQFYGYSQGGHATLESCVQKAKAYWNMLAILYDSSLPVNIVNFDYVLNENKITLIWNTSTEVNNAGFEIYKSLDNKDFTLLSSYKDNDGLMGGNFSDKHYYSFADKINNNTWYRLYSVSYNGEVEQCGHLAVEFIKPNIYPNPFRNYVNIEISEPYRVYIYDILGRNMGKIDKQEKWGESVSNGIYFYQTILNDKIINSGKIIKIK